MNREPQIVWMVVWSLIIGGGVSYLIALVFYRRALKRYNEALARALQTLRVAQAALDDSDPRQQDLKRLFSEAFTRQDS